MVVVPEPWLLRCGRLGATTVDPDPDPDPELELELGVGGVTVGDETRGAVTGALTCGAAVPADAGVAADRLGCAVR
jgi:hypothetical protein